MSDLQTALSYANHHGQDYLEKLISLLKIPSDSMTRTHAKDVRQAAVWVAARLRDLHFDQIDVIETPGHPLVFGILNKGGGYTPTILVYGHYDVQPAGALEEWHSHPFQPEIRGDYLYARGASDMKAQLVAFLNAVEAVIQTNGLKVNLKCIFEGEEEVGSTGLEAYLCDHADLLAADFCLNLDAGILAPDTPSIMYSLRGISYFELDLHGPAHDLHSGKFGGPIENPAVVLCDLISGMKDQQGRITLPGFYDAVKPLTSEERNELDKLHQTDQWWLAQAGVKALRHDPDYSATELATSRPTLDVHGILSGYTEDGSKTVLPARAMVKFSMRLVPNQTPEQVRKGLETYLKESMPQTMTWELKEVPGCEPIILNRETLAVQAAKEALEAVWGKPPLFTRDGGSVPIVSLMKDLLGLDTLLLGFGLPDDNPHGPDEKQHLPTFYRGIETYMRFLDRIGQV